MLSRTTAACWGLLLQIVSFMPICAAICLSGPLVSRATAQNADAMDIAWDAPPSCPQESAIRHAVQHWLEQSLEPLDPAQVSVDGHIRAEGQGFVLELALESPSGHSEEQLRAQRCETLADAVALKVMLAATPPGAEDAARPPRPRRPRRAYKRAAAGGDEAGIAESSPAGSVTTLDVVLALQGGVALSVLNQASPLIGVQAGLQWTRVRLALGFEYHSQVERRYADLPSVGADVQLIAGRAQLCYAPLPRPFELAACAGVEFGLMRGTGFGVTTAFSSDQLWAGATLGPSLRVPLAAALSLAIDVQGLAALARPSYHVRSLNLLYQPKRWGARAAVGIELRI